MHVQARPILDAPVLLCALFDYSLLSVNFFSDSLMLCVVQVYPLRLCVYNIHDGYLRPGFVFTYEYGAFFILTD